MTMPAPWHSGRTHGPRVMRPWEWAFPPRGEHLEVIAAQPATDHGHPPILFVPGLGHGAWCYAEHWLGATAERGYPAYAMSFRGHGGSGGHTRLGRATTRTYLHDLMQVIASLPAPPVLVAHSMAALPARLALARYPAPAGVLLAPVPAGGLRQSLTNQFRRRPAATMRTLVGGTAEFTAVDLFADLDAATAARHLSRLGRESPLAQYELMVPHRIEPIDSPVLVVGAEADRVLAPADLDRAAAELHTSAVMVPGGHDMMLDRSWGEVLTTVLDWIDLHGTAAGAALPGATKLPPVAQALEGRPP